MKARLFRFTLLICLFALALSGAYAGTVELSQFEIDDNLVRDTGGIFLKAGEGTGQTINFTETSVFDQFTGENKDWWTIEAGRALVKKADVTRLPDGQKYVLSLTKTTDKVEFQYEVSSEPDYDWFEFYIDDKLEERASGKMDSGPGKVTKTLTQGSHTFKWVYKKDECGRSNKDTAFLDFIKFGSGAERVGIATVVVDAGTVKQWNTLSVVKEGTDSSSSVDVQVVANDNANTPVATAWKPFSSGIRGRYLHIKLTFRSSTQAQPKVTGITYTAEAVPYVVLSGPEKVKASPNLTWVVKKEEIDITTQTTAVKVRASNNSNMTGAIEKPLKAGSSAYTWSEKLADGNWYFQVRATLGVESDWSIPVRVLVDNAPPTVNFVNFKERYDSSPQLTIQLVDPSGLAEGSKVEVTRNNQEYANNPTGNLISSDKLEFRFTPSLSEPGLYTIKVTAIDGLNNSKTETKIFFLGKDLSIEPSFVIVPKKAGAKQGFQFFAKVGNGDQKQLRTNDLVGITKVGNAACGTFDSGPFGSTLYFTANGQAGIGTLTATVAGMTAQARVSTGTGLVARLEDWELLNSGKSLPITVYTPGGIKIAELPPQQGVYLWDGLADYGKHAGKQGLPGLYLFKAEGREDTKETLKEEPAKNLQVTATVNAQAVSFTTSTLASNEIVYASAYIKQGTEIVRWLGTKAVKAGEVKPTWSWDGELDKNITGTYKAFVQLVTPGGQGKESDGVDITRPGGITGLGMKMMNVATKPVVTNDAGQLVEDENWKYEYNQAGQLIKKVGHNNQSTYSYAYDMEGRLVRTELNGTLQREVSYDGDGRMVKEKVIEGEVERSFFYVYDKDERLAYQKIIRNDNGQITVEEKIYPSGEEGK